jgi:hypothetical protein
MFTSWVMLVVFFVIAIFAANLLVAPFTQSGIKLDSMACSASQNLHIQSSIDTMDVHAIDVMNFVRVKCSRPSYLIL